MTKPRAYLILALVLALGSGCAAVSPTVAPREEDPARQILVSFVDRSLARPPSGSPGGYLRRSAQYGTTSWSHGVGQEISLRHHLRTVTEWPIMTLGVHCVVYAIDDDRTVADVIEELRQDQSVGAVQAMGTFRVLSSDPYQNLQRSLNGMNIERAHKVATGSGIVIAMVDTGVDIHHPDLAGQITAHRDFARPQHGQAFDNDVHGTAIAGVIAALADNGQGIVGVAPDAQLLVYRACWPIQEWAPAAVCNSLTLATALDVAIRAGPDIINMSLTGPSDPLVEALLATAIANKILIVVAEPPFAGSKPDFARGVVQVIRVQAAGSGVEDRDNTIPGTLRAPGTDILTTFPHGTYNFISGNSFAAANVSGVIALLLQARPKLSHVDLRHALQTTSSDDAAGIDACAALALLDTSASCTR